MLDIIKKHHDIFEQSGFKISMIIVVIYLLLAILSSFNFELLDWQQEVGKSYQTPSLKNLLGTDIFGRSVLFKILKGCEVAMSVGVFTSIISILIGVSLGIIAGYYGGKIDEFIVWLYTVQSSIPYIMLIVSITYILGKGMTSLYMALGLTSWVSLSRIIRIEVIKIKTQEYFIAADVLGASDIHKVLTHILPNISHYILIYFSLIFQTAIKSEVIVSYLGLGMQDGPSWGSMIDDAKLELSRGVWWQLIFATIAMMIIVLALNYIGDILRDKFDPRLKGF